jgi:Patatin-like phospholipase
MSLASLLLIIHAESLSGMEHYNVRVWPMIDPVAQGKDPKNPRPHLRGARPPEQIIPSIKAELAKKDDLGLAFSGGGTVSSVATSGELAALRQMGLLDRVKYISGVSGGTWGALPYVYLNAENEMPKLKGSDLETLNQTQLDERYLGLDRGFVHGRVLEPGELTRAFFDELPIGSAVRMAAKTSFAVHLLNFRGNESFAHMIGGTFLEPVGMGDESRFFSWTRNYFSKEVQPRNASTLSEKRFYFTPPGRPYLIANSALDRVHRTSVGDKLTAIVLGGKLNSVSNGFWPLEITPAYTGMWAYTDHDDPKPKGKGENTIFPEARAGGGYVETFGYDSKFLSFDPDHNGHVTLRLIRPGILAFRRSSEFSLADACAGSGSAPAAFAGAVAQFFGLRPSFHTFPTWEANPSKDAHNYPHADGGACDNTGVTALLVRKVRHIIVFLNSASPYKATLIPPDADDKIMPEKDNPEKYSITPRLPTMLTALFGKSGSDGWRNDLLDESVVNHVLEDENDKRLVEIDRAFSRCVKEGKPLVYCADYHTVSDATAKFQRTDKSQGQGYCGLDHYGIAPGQPVRICWVYLTSKAAVDSKGKLACSRLECEDPWIKDLKPEVKALFTDQESIKKHHLSQFPALPTAFPSGKGVQDIDPVAANGLANYAAFNVNHSAATIKSVMK